MLSRYRWASRSRFSAAVSPSSSELSEFSGSSSGTCAPSSASLSLPLIDSSRTARRGARALDSVLRRFGAPEDSSPLFRLRCEAGVVKNEDMAAACRGGGVEREVSSKQSANFFSKTDGRATHGATALVWRSSAFHSTCGNNQQQQRQPHYDHFSSAPITVFPRIPRILTRSPPRPASPHNTAQTTP
jgi:hypothetical protein